MQPLPPAAQALTDLGIQFRVYQHHGQVTSLEQAARERNQLPRQVVRSLVFRLGPENFVMVLMPGQTQASWPALRAYFGQSRLTLASPEEVLTATGYRIGAVSPFGLPGKLRMLADESIFNETEISLGSGEPNRALLLNSADLKKALPHLEIGQFAELK